MKDSLSLPVGAGVCSIERSSLMMILANHVFRKSMRRAQIRVAPSLPSKVLGAYAARPQSTSFMVITPRKLPAMETRSLP